MNISLINWDKSTKYSFIYVAKVREKLQWQEEKVEKMLVPTEKNLLQSLCLKKEKVPILHIVLTEKVPIVHAYFMEKVPKIVVLNSMLLHYRQTARMVRKHQYPRLSRHGR